jgi:hypothetical protein
VIEPPKLVESKYHAIYPKTRPEKYHDITLLIPKNRHLIRFWAKAQTNSAAGLSCDCGVY